MPKETIKPIAHISTDFSQKFGIPRQSGLVDELKGKIIFEKEYRNTDAVKGLEEFSHIWLIWQFSKSKSDTFYPTVRPPRLGGNKRIGVFASRSPNRPNSLGLSCVKLNKIDYESKLAPVLYVSGIDMLDKTPIFDIKPYIPFCDIRKDATEGYTKTTKLHRLNIVFDEDMLTIIPKDKKTALLEVLSNDPRPGYDNDPSKEYGLEFAGFDIGFSVCETSLKILRITNMKENKK